MSNQSAQPSVENLTEAIIDAIQDVKGKDIVHMDLRKLEATPTENFVVCSGDSSTQVRAISGRIQRNLKEKFGILPNHIEGKDNGEWVLVDYFNVVVHIFHGQSREFYDIEGLWSDADVRTFENL